MAARWIHGPVLVMAVVLIVGPMALAQEAVPLRSVLLYPTSLITGDLGIVTQQQIAPNRAFVLESLFATESVLDATVSVVGMGAGVKHFPDGVVFDGVYIGGQVQYAYLSGWYSDPFTFDFYTISGSVLALTGMAGYSIPLGKGMLVDFGAVMALPLSARVMIDGESHQLVSSDFGSLILGTGFTFALGYQW